MNQVRGENLGQKKSSYVQVFFILELRVLVRGNLGEYMSCIYIIGFFGIVFKEYGYIRFDTEGF